jgi:putative flippase GtrA
MLYLITTWLGVEPKMAITILYPLAAIYGYFLHKRFSFLRIGGGQNGAAMVRYIIVNCIGYLINICLIYVLHDQLGYSHQFIQVVAIIVVASFLFFALKLFVFRATLKSKTKNL